MLLEGTVTAKVFTRLLQRQLIRAKRPIFLIVDGHPTHKAKLVKSFIESTDGQRKLFFLPPYSPRLNPDETMWTHVKCQASKNGVATKSGVEDQDQLKRLASRALRRIQKRLPLVRSFFQQPNANTRRSDFAL